MKKSKRKPILVIAVLALLLAVLPACGVPSPGSEPEEPPSAETAAPEPTPAPTPEPEPVSEPEPSPEESVDCAPDFTVYDAEGNALRLSDLRGRPVVLNFWATWCPPCREELPHFDAAYAELGGEIVFMMIDLTDGYSETVDGVLAFLEDTGYGFPVYYDKDMDAATAYEISAIPLTVLIDAQGREADRHLGSMTAAQLESLLDQLR